MVHGLRNCQSGEWLYQRDTDAFFVTEEAGFLDAITPLATAFVDHAREDLFVQLMEIIHRHWQTAAGAAAAPDECALTPTTRCTKDGADTYEPLLAKIFSSDLLPALNHLTQIAAGMTIPTCGAVDALTHRCTAPGTRDGIGLLAAATRALVDPNAAKSFGLTDSAGRLTSRRNDGSTNAQVTPLYVLLQALDEIDAVFAQNAAAGPANPDPQRQAEWRLARSQLVDEFLSVKNANMPGQTQTFADPAIPKLVPLLVDVVRAQLLARCGNDETTGKCRWARGDVRTPVVTPASGPPSTPVPLWNEAMTTLSGPLFAATTDLLDAMRLNAGARAAQEDLLTYLVDPRSKDSVNHVEALTELLSSTHDVLQILDDAQNLFTPVYRVLSSSFAPPASHPGGRTLVDSTTALLTRLAARAYDTNGREICANELDPNDVISVALAYLVTPNCASSGGSPCAGETPLEVIVDTIADVNRAADSTSPEVLRASDYANVTSELEDFLLDPQRGLEQFYAIVRQGTEH
jgi:hypothetical protein